MRKGANKRMRMPTGKLLVYVDGRCFPDRMTASFAAYYVDAGTRWRGGSNEVIERHLRLRARRNPVVHKREIILGIGVGETPTGDLAEAKALLKAVAWTKEFLRTHKNIKTVEFCMDSSLIIYAVCGMNKTNGTNLRSVLVDIWKGLWSIRARVLWGLIPGTLMKRTIIEH